MQRKRPSSISCARRTALPVRLTNVNSALAAYAYPESIEVQWHAPDGQPNDGILTYPNGYQPGKRYPLVVYTHGGPEAASSGDFDVPEIGPLRDLFAARGFLVFEPNYRGSDNLGNAHEHSIYRDPGAGPDSDVISGIKMLEGKGIVDTSRIAAVGHSYGGYMTGWLISHQHFWRCAVVANGALDWTEEYELSAAGNLAWTRDSARRRSMGQAERRALSHRLPDDLCRRHHHADTDPFRYRRYHRADHGDPLRSITR